MNAVHHFSPGETFPRDCNTCTCHEDGTFQCTTESCPCVERPSHHGLTDSFSFFSVPPDGLPQCLPNCGATPQFGGGTYSVDALPVGACDPFTFGCTMLAREGCRCPNEAGPVDSFACTCDGGSWNCQIAFKGASICANACYRDAGAPDSEGIGPCDLTNQLTLSGPGVVLDAVAGRLSVGATLTNRGPRDHNAYPGIEGTSDADLGTPTPLANAFYALRSGESEPLGVSFDVPLDLVCSTLNFHIRAHSFGSESTCPGQSVDVSFFFGKPDGSNCPACPSTSPKTSDQCSISGLVCDYVCRPGTCGCSNGHWVCNGCI